MNPEGGAQRVRRGIMASVTLLVVALAGWEWGFEWLGVPHYIVPPVSMVYDEFFFMFETERVVFHTLVTLMETMVGFVLGALLGMVVGYALGMSPWAELVFSPYLLALQIAPKVAFAPLFILWFGYTVFPKILVAVLIVFFPIMVNVLGALRAVDQDLINLARSFKASRVQIFWNIEFPASMPALFSGLRVGATLAVIGVVVGEMVGGNIGLGYLLVFGEGSANTAMVFVSILLLTLIGVLAYVAVIILERKVLHYLPSRSFGDA